jgi:hypothetical protein
MTDDSFVIQGRICDNQRDWWAIPMFPSRDQIERAAYDRWIRRHRAHGYDRIDWIDSEHELTYQLNYETVVDYPLGPAVPVVIGEHDARRFRLCERTGRYAAFSAPRPVLQGIAGAILSAEVCDECQAECREPLAAGCEKLWKILRAGASAEAMLPRQIDSVAALKSLVTSALLALPEPELAYFNDTIDWLNNPDHEYDAGLFAGSYCHVYQLPFGSDQSWVTLARRIDDDALLPYMVFFVASCGVIVQISVPLSIRDHDLDGRVANLPVRSFTTGDGPHFCAVGPSVLGLVDLGSRTRARVRVPFLVS